MTKSFRRVLLLLALFVLSASSVASASGPEPRPGKKCSIAGGVGL